MDIKLQANRGDRDPQDWDQRKTEGEFQGSPENVHVKTLAEFRTHDDIFTNPDRLTEFIQPGDNAVMLINRILDQAAKQQPAIFGNIASLTGLGGSGPVGLDFLVYDDD